MENDDAFGCVCTRKDVDGFGWIARCTQEHCREEGSRQSVRQSPLVSRFEDALSIAPPWPGRIDGVGGQQFEPEGHAVGDFVLKRADGFWAYHMASGGG